MQPKIRWWKLNQETIELLNEKVNLKGEWDDHQTCTSMWNKGTHIIKVVAQEVLGVSSRCNKGAKRLDGC